MRPEIREQTIPSSVSALAETVSGSDQDCFLSTNAVAAARSFVLIRLNSRAFQNRSIELSSAHSDLRATAGSTCIALRAGRYAASNPVVATSPQTPASTIGLRAPVP